MGKIKGWRKVTGEDTWMARSMTNIFRGKMGHDLVGIIEGKVIIMLSGKRGIQKQFRNRKDARNFAIKWMRENPRLHGFQE